MTKAMKWFKYNLRFNKDRNTAMYNVFEVVCFNQFVASTMERSILMKRVSVLRTMFIRLLFRICIKMHKITC